MQVLNALPTLPPEQLPRDAVFESPGTDLLLKMLVTTGAVNVRLARYLGGDWVWHPVGTLTWDPAVQDSDTTAASKTAAKRFERVICDDIRSFWAIVKVGGPGVITKAELYAAQVGGARL